MSTWYMRIACAVWVDMCLRRRSCAAAEEAVRVGVEGAPACECPPLDCEVFELHGGAARVVVSTAPLVGCAECDFVIQAAEAHAVRLC